MNHVKKRIALLLSLIFLLTIIMPLNSFAAGIDKGLENAIKVVKTKFSIPEDYKFTSSVVKNGDETFYYLTWNSKDTLVTKTINATVDDDGIIIEYGKYSSDDYYGQGKKLPALSKAEAKAKADEYIEHIAPGLLNELRYQEDYSDNIYDSDYYLNYYRVVNDVPYYNDMVRVTINRDTGELRDYSRNWTDDVEFPPANGVLTAEAAEKAYAEKLGLRLIYSYTSEDDGLKAFLLYAPVYDNSDFAIDAFTGEKIRLASGACIAFSENAAAEQKQRVLKAAGESVKLTPEEQKAVEEAGKLISLEEAEKIARSAEFTGLTGDFKLQDYYLNTNWIDNSEYLWSLSFEKKSEDGKTEDYVSISVNANTREITDFYRYTPDTGNKKPVKDISKIKEITDAFLQKYYPQYSKQLEYDVVSNEEYLADKAVPADSYTIRYTRLVNGIPFPGNGVVFSYDNINERITSFSLDWYNINIPAEDDVIGLEEAYKSLFGKIGLELEYVYAGSKYIAPVNTEEKQEKEEAKLVYLLNSGKPLYIDALTGKVVYRTGTEYVEPKKVSYTDISGHFAEKQISVLADFGIYLDGNEFRPDEKITQLDFLSLLSRTLNYYGPVITKDSTQDDINNLYAYLIREGIVTEEEKAPDSTVKREEAVKYIIRALGYNKVAEIKGIFNVSFKDKSEISENLYGYVAIASGLGIVKGDGVSFKPKNDITRAESAVMIYNYLQS